MKTKRPLRLRSQPNPDSSTSEGELQEIMLQDQFIISPKDLLAQLIRDLRAMAPNDPNKREAERVCGIAENVYEARFPGEVI